MTVEHSWIMSMIFVVGALSVTGTRKGAILLAFGFAWALNALAKGLGA